MRNRERYEERAWQILYELAKSLIDATGVNILFNKAIYLKNGNYKFIYMGDEELFGKIFENLKKLGLKLCKEQIKDTFKTLTKDVYQHSCLGFAPTVLDHDHAVTFYMINHIPVRSKKEIERAQRNGLVEDPDIKAYRKMQKYEKYLGYDFKVGESRYTSIVTIYPLTPLWQKKGFAVVWCPYKVGDINDFNSAKFCMAKADTMIQNLLPKINSIFTLLSTLDLIVHEIKPDSNALEIFDKFYHKEYAFRLRIGNMLLYEIIEGAEKKLIEDMIDIKKRSITNALRSAVAAIMARNRAHIFDSQVLVRFKNLEEGDFSKLKDYIITRSEYIANVTGEIPILWGEGYLERKVGETSVSGIIQEFRDVEVHTKLAEASSEKIPLIDIVVDGLDQRIGFPFGASVGRHAIYGILENYIRNVSKYGFINSNNKELIITLQKNSEKDGYIWVKLSSNSKIATNKASYKNRAEEIAKYVKSPVVGPTGEHLRKGWGLSEMKIHACFLAGENINLLLKEGTLPFFEFDENAAKNSGDYVFRFKVRRYEPYLYLKTEEKAGQFISEPMSFPLCDFVVLGPNVSQFYDRNNWHVFPTRVGIVGKNKSKQNWLDKRMIYIDQDKNLETKLWEKFWELLKKHVAVEYEVKILDNTYNVEFGNGKKLALYHDEDYLRRQAGNFAQQTIIRFSHQKLMNIWLDELKKAQGKTIPKLKWLVLLGAKVLLVDTRLYEQWESLDEVTKNELAILGVHVVPESCKFHMKNKTIICNWKNQKRTQELNLSSLQFISVHLGYLEENPNSALLKENNLTMLPPFIFMHTMRGKIDKEFIKKNWWFKKIISVGSLLSAFNENYGLEIKMRLMGLMLSPQQAKEV